MGRRRNRSSSDSRRSRRRDRSRRTSRSRSPSGRRDRFPETQPRTPSVGISSMRATQPGFHWCQVPTAAFGVASGPQAQASLSAQKGAEAASSWKYSSRWQEHGARVGGNPRITAPAARGRALVGIGVRSGTSLKTGISGGGNWRLHAACRVAGAARCREAYCIKSCYAKVYGVAVALPF